MDKKSDAQLTPLERARYEQGHAHLLNYHKLKKYGVAMFEADGSIITTHNGKEIHRPGRDFIVKHIRFFIELDEPVYYHYCTVLQRVLDAFDEKFKVIPERT